MINDKENKKIKCLECGKYFNRLGGGHLEKIHGVTKKEYLIKYPNAETSSIDFKERQKEIKKEHYKNNSSYFRKEAGSRTFDFIKNKDLRKLLQRDYKTAKNCLKKNCLKYELWKPCIILYGAIIEAILIDMTGKIKFDEAIDEALRKNIIRKNQSNEIHVVRNWRNYVHLHKELKEEIKISDYWAKALAEFCESIIKYFYIYS